MIERKALAARLREMVAGAIAGGTGFKLNDLARAADLLDPPARGRTVRVRIACAVDEKGGWYAVGGAHWSAGDAAQSARCGTLVANPLVVWVEASVPLPDETTVEGEVS